MGSFRLVGLVFHSVSLVRLNKWCQVVFLDWVIFHSFGTGLFPALKENPIFWNPALDLWVNVNLANLQKIVMT